MRWFTGILLSFLPGIAAPHPVSLTWAHARLIPDKVVINFKILAEDLLYFHHPQPDEFYNYPVNELRGLAAPHGDLLIQYFYIIDENGECLDAKILSTKDNLPDRDSVNVMDLMRYDIQFKIEFTLHGAEWTKLIINQEFGDFGIGIPAVTFLSVFQDQKTLVKNVEVSPGNPFILRKGQQSQEQDKSPSELTSSFFTITPAGIRHELTLPNAIFHGLTALPPKGASRYEQAEDYFQHHNAVYGNKKKLTPRLKHLKSLEALEEGSLTGLDGFVYLDIFYPAEKALEHSKITWTDYGWKFRWFNSEIQTIDSSYQHTFSRFQPVFYWKTKVRVAKMKH